MQVNEESLKEGFVAALVIATIVAYYPSFSVWFFLDDFRIILENPALQNAWNPVAVWEFSRMRAVASWTMAVNYTLHGEAVFGYHLVNFLIHLSAGAAVWWLVRGLLRSPAFSEQNAPWMRWIPWLAVAIFLLHPLQTQAITYIVQRYTSLMAMFYLISMAAFVWARLQASPRWFVLSAIAGVLALFSKQPAATLPLALILIELLFFRRLGPKAWSMVVGSAVILSLVLAWLLTLPAFDIHGLTRETLTISRMDYLATQMEVLWRYIGLFFLIGQQRLEYDLALASGFSEMRTIVFALGHLGLIGIGLALWRRLPLVAFGILFFYLAHIIESTYFPIIDVAFEHRNYLPLAGLALSSAVGLAWLSDRLVLFRIGVVISLGLIAVLAVHTHARNTLWADPIAFLQHETTVAPNSQRAWTSLGKELMREGRFRQALSALEKAFEVARTHNDGRVEPAGIVNMVFALHYTGHHRQAIDLANQSPVTEFTAIELSFFYEARGRSHFALEEFTQAREDLQQSARINPSENAIAFLAATELRLGNRDRARQLAREVLRVAPYHPLARDVMREVH
jgi:protein O-mannosyl-transferase